MNIIETVYAQTIANAPTFSGVASSILNFLLRFFSIIAIIGLIISGLIYFTAGGNMERVSLAKRAFWYSIVGILITLGANIIIKQIGKLLF
ncbi:MAG TPA: hypothetical protein ENJ27_00580 [Candidatus Moranbacteria bacterium]|nr:hypothetical protein [Candidatus Moranbacteria bacterium]